MPPGYPQDLVSRIGGIYQRAERIATRRVLVAARKAGTEAGLTVIRTRLRDEIRTIMRAAKTDSDALLGKGIPDFYNRERAEMERALRAGGVAAVPIARVHTAVVEILASNAVNGIGGAAALVARRVDDRFRAHALDELAVSRAAGISPREIAKRLEGRLRKDLRNGLPGFIDRSGREWNVATYSRMVTRTTLREAGTQSKVRAALAAGVDLVRIEGVSADDDSPCLPFQGEILSLSGRTPGYVTIADARSQGLFHPNCVHSIAPFISPESVGEPMDEEEINRATAAFAGALKEPGAAGQAQGE